MSDFSIHIGGGAIPHKFIAQSFSHSGGHGGQNVNKTNTKVHLRLELGPLDIDQQVKSRLLEVFPEGHVLAWSQETRSQHRNLELAYRHLQRQVNEALVEVKGRKRRRSRGGRRWVSGLRLGKIVIVNGKISGTGEGHFEAKCGDLA
jgi:protein subunit release factor B